MEIREHNALDDESDQTNGEVHEENYKSMKNVSQVDLPYYFFPTLINLFRVISTNKDLKNKFSSIIWIDSLDIASPTVVLVEWFICSHTKIFSH